MMDNWRADDDVKVEIVDDGYEPDDTVEEYKRLLMKQDDHLFSSNPPS